jgi:hypothetical protein
LIFARFLPAKVRALLFLAFIISSVWFSYWICYDVFVWNKALTQAAPINYVGLVGSIALAIIGTQLGKSDVPEKTMSSPEQNVYEEETERQEVPELEKVEPIKEVQRIQSAEEETKQIPPGASVPPGCKFYLGYLNDRPESVEIPEECLACEHVVECLSPTANTINVQVHETA